MTPSTQLARITGPVVARSTDGRTSEIPLGPCLVAQEDDRRVDIFWGTTGEHSAALSQQELRSAEDAGNLVMLD